MADKKKSKLKVSRTSKISKKTEANPSSGDTLNQYLSDISQLKPLTREEEANLAVQIREGNTQSMQELVKRNLKYVVTVANRYRGCGVPMQDLIEEGNIGLIQAAKRFDESHHVKFITYAVWWIRQAILHFLAEQSGTVKLPVKQAGKLYKIERKFTSMAQDLDREPTSAEVAQDMGLSVEEIENIMRAYRTHLSLDTPLKKDEVTEYIDLLENPEFIPYDDQMMRESLSAKVDSLLKHLNEREEKILRLRFGFNGDAKTLEEIGKELGLSRERVRQIEKRAKARLRSRSDEEHMEDHLV